MQKKQEEDRKHQQQLEMQRKQEEERKHLPQEQIKKIYPGCKLYHRANYIRDKENSFGEITVKSFDGKYIVCDTN